MLHSTLGIYKFKTRPSLVGPAFGSKQSGASTTSHLKVVPHTSRAVKPYSIALAPNCENNVFVSISDAFSCGNMGAKLAIFMECVIRFGKKLLPHSIFPQFLISSIIVTFVLKNPKCHLIILFQENAQITN